MNDEPQHKHRKYWLLCIFAVFIAILGVVLPEIEFTPLTYINASNISYSGLVNVNGNISDISEINHGNWSADETTSPWWINITFTNVTHFSFPEIKLLYFSTVGASTHVNDIEIYCITEHTFVDLSTFTNQIEWLYWTRHVPDSMHFVDANGNVTIRLNHSSNGNTNHRIKLDVVRLVEQSQFEAVTTTLIQYFNTTTTGGGGGVSFNNATTDLNGTELRNGTIANYSTLDYTNTSLNNKVNKTGDNISGKICIYNDTMTCDFVSALNEPFLINTSIDNGAISKIATQMEISGLSHAPTSYAYGMHLSTKVAPANVSVYAPAWGVGFYSAAQCDTAFGNFGNCAAGYLARLTKNGTGSVTTAYGLYIEKQDVATTNYAIYSAGNNMSYLAGNLTLNPLAGAGNAYACLDSNGRLFRGSPGC